MVFESSEAAAVSLDDDLRSLISSRDKNGRERADLIGVDGRESDMLCGVLIACVHVHVPRAPYVLLANAAAVVVCTRLLCVAEWVVGRLLLDDLRRVLLYRHVVSELTFSNLNRNKNSESFSPPLWFVSFPWRTKRSKVESWLPRPCWGLLRTHFYSQVQVPRYVGTHAHNSSSKWSTGRITSKPLARYCVSCMRLSQKII